MSRLAEESSEEEEPRPKKTKRDVPPVYRKSREAAPSKGRGRGRGK